MAAAALRALLAAALFGVSTPVAKALLGTVHPVLLAGLFYLGGALAVAPRVWTRWRAGGRIVPSDLPNRLRLLGAVALGAGVAPVLVFLGLAHARAASVSILLNLETVATALLGVLVFREHLGRLSALGNVLVFGAGVALAFEGGFSEALPALAVAAAALCWGLDNHLTALLDGIRPEESTFFKGIVAGTVNVVLGMILARASLPGPGALAGSLAVGAVAYGASIVLYIQSAQVLGAIRSQMVFASAPFFGVLVAVGALGEGFTAIQAGALALLVGGNALLLLDRHGHDHAHEAQEHEHAHDHDDGHHDHAHDGVVGRHVHPHRHDPTVHAHPHLPDLHHRHGH